MVLVFCGSWRKTSKLPVSGMKRWNPLAVATHIRLRESSTTLRTSLLPKAPGREGSGRKLWHFPVFRLNRPSPPSAVATQRKPGRELHQDRWLMASPFSDPGTLGS